MQIDNERIAKILMNLKNFHTWEDKEKSLITDKVVVDYLRSHSEFSLFLNSLDTESRVCLLQVIALGQAEALFGDLRQTLSDRQGFENMIRILKYANHFYAPLGGLVGYHYTLNQKLTPHSESSRTFHKPPLYNGEVSQEMYRWGIEALPYLAEIYVLGGAADRLNFTDPKTGEHLPAGFLPFMGKSLLEGLLLDLQAKEYLYFKLYGKQLETPVVMMTSLSFCNHDLIQDFCAERKWFGRSPHLFKMVAQPLVPMISSEGDWCVEKPLQPCLRPGGHGALWKLAIEEGVFDWLQQQKRDCLLIRQINNPLSGIDGGLLAFVGIGWKQKKSFGFTSCERKKGAAEGVNVLVAEKEGDQTRYAITNVEYTNLPPELSTEGPEWKNYPANTNILFANIQAMQIVFPKNPLPGLVVNMKTHLHGKHGDVLAGRVESLMQNIADVVYSEPLPENQSPEASQLPSFVFYNDRGKTISTTKREFKGDELSETPPGAYYDILLAYYDLFNNHCKMEIPQVGITKDYLENRWGFLAYLHPALGPLFDIISQKIQAGKIGLGSTIELEIAELHLLNLDLKGSLKIISEKPIDYQNKNGRCSLRNVTVENRGINKDKCIPWKKEINYQECLEIILEGNGELFAKDITLKGNLKYVVPDGHRMTLSQEGEEIHANLQKISTPSWWWHYAYDSDSTIKLNKMAQA